MIMKRKPILFDCLNQKKRNENSQTIGFIGTHHGTGVTHSSLMLSFYLGEYQNRRTALLECNQHRDLGLIQDAYEWSREEGNSFSYHNITCFREASANSISHVLNNDFERYVLDFGIDLNANREEFLRCGTKIVVASQSTWGIQRLNQFIERSQTIRGNENWLYLIPFASSKGIKELQSQWKRDFYSVPFQADPTFISRQVNRFFYEEVKLR